ncbi:MAG: formyltransferase family protein [Ignavibacteriaceae bacterium]
MLNILLVTQDDPFYVPIFFKELLKKDISGKFVLKGIIIQPPLGKKSVKKLVLQMLHFYGYWGFLVMGIKFVSYKLLNYMAVNIFHGKMPGVFSAEHVILKNNLNIIHIKNINSKESLDFLKALNIDVVFSVAASQIFKKGILELPRIGCFNIHTSKLPKNRGMMPNFWSLYNYDKDPVSAITIHKMNDKLDDGEILIQHEFKLNPEEPLEHLIKRTKKISAELFLKAIEKLDKGEQDFIKNDNTCATYNTFPVKKDIQAFKAKGLRIR